MHKAHILPLAKQDIKEAARWYNEKSPGLGKSSQPMSDKKFSTFDRILKLRLFVTMTSGPLFSILSPI